MPNAEHAKGANREVGSFVLGVDRELGAGFWRRARGKRGCYEFRMEKDETGVWA